MRSDVELGERLAGKRALLLPGLATILIVPAALAGALIGFAVRERQAAA